jgi:uncharacterized oligopeptide transporter (OPT) family protein
MTAVLGAANAYLGLKAGMTIAATYPAAVIGMALLRLMGGSLLEENIARTVGSIGESVAAGAVFTIPAFVLSGAWQSFDFGEAYWKSTVLMMVGGVLGILFVTLLRRVMVEDPELPFPESVAASEIHKAGQQGGKAAGLLFQAMGFGAVLYSLGAHQAVRPEPRLSGEDRHPGQHQGAARRRRERPVRERGRHHHLLGARREPGVPRRGIHHRPETRRAELRGRRGRLGPAGAAADLLPGPAAARPAAAGGGDVLGPMNVAVWKFIVRPIAVGGMLVGACYTLFRMRKSLAIGMKRAVSDLKKSGAQAESTLRTQRDLSAKLVFAGLGVTFLCMIALYTYYAGMLSGGIVAAVVMIILGFFFAAVSGNLVGMIGSSNNPVSGLTLSTLIVAALLMVSIGVSGNSGVAAVLGVAAVVCVSSAVAGEMLQDLKVGHILGGTPRYMQIGDILGIMVASAVLYFPLLMAARAATSRPAARVSATLKLPAPQAGLMAALAQGIVGGNMPWPLVVVGIFMGFALIMVQVRSPMLFAVGMYMPLETTFAIFLGGVFRWLTDTLRDRRGFNDAQKARVENAGVLTASGLIAGRSAHRPGAGRLPVLERQAAGDLQIAERAAGLRGAGDPGDLHDPGAAAQRGQSGRAGAADGHHVINICQQALRRRNRLRHHNKSFRSRQAVLPPRSEPQSRAEGAPSGSGWYA